MFKKVFGGLLLGLTVMAGTCFAQVDTRLEIYKGNELKIPQVAGIEEKSAAKINSYIYKNVAGDAKKFIDKHGKEGGTAWLYTTIVRDDDQYLSLLVASASYFKQAAHPNTYVFGLVFDKKTGRRLPLSHFVTMPPKDQLAGYVRKGIFKLYAPGNTPLELDEKDYPLTYISKEFTLDKDDNLDLYYQQYELGCYAIGTPHIRLDKEYVDRNGSVLPKG